MALLNLTNFDDHPTDPLWMVFRFPSSGISLEFQEALTSASIPFEVDMGEGPPFLVGVKTRYRDRSVPINYAVIGRHREPFIADRSLRWGLIVFLVLLLVLVALGMVFST